MVQRANVRGQMVKRWHEVTRIPNRVSRRRRRRPTVQIAERLTIRSLFRDSRVQFRSKGSARERGKATQRASSPGRAKFNPVISRFVLVLLVCADRRLRWMSARPDLVRRAG